MINTIKAAGKYRQIIAVLSLLLLLISLTQPAFYVKTEDPDAWSDSTFLFFLGWMGILGGSLESLIWFANPIYFFALIFFIRGKRKATILASIATAMALSFALLPDVLVSESGRRARIASLEYGYILWVASFSTILLGIIIERMLPRKIS